MRLSWKMLMEQPYITLEGDRRGRASTKDEGRENGEIEKGLGKERARKKKEQRRRKKGREGEE